MKSNSLLPIVAFLTCTAILTWVIAGPKFPNPEKTELPAPDAFSKGEENAPPTDPPITKPIGTAPAGMTWIPGGAFSMGTNFLVRPGRPNPDKIKQDEYPAHQVIVDGFWMDVTEVTNTQFAKFVEETNYVTSAEITPKREDFIGVVPDISLIPEENLVPGSLVFKEDFDRKKLRKDIHAWEYQAWKYQKNADWRHPTGPKSSIEKRMDHPAVNLTYADCIAYCKWAKKRLPTEAEWEYASRGGVKNEKYPWGNELTPDGKYMCNYWQGDFPTDRQNKDGFLETSPVKSFPANRYGLYDMSGNVWEWVNDYYRIDYYRHCKMQGTVHNPKGPDTFFDPGEPRIEKRVTRGGSFMCNTNNCTGYRNAARMRSDVSSASFHTGFRCVVDATMIKKQESKKVEN